jgi:5-hydroxyisourate hydrolase
MISTNIHDLSRGNPASRVPVELDYFISGHGWREVGRGVTNSEGYIYEFGEPAAQGLYRLMFDIASYNPHSFFPSISVTFEVADPNERTHIPLLLSPYGYSVHKSA